MTLDQFLRKYTKCPFCRNYVRQINCRGCQWRFANGQYAKDDDIDKFDPKEEWHILMNKEVTE